MGYRVPGTRTLATASRWLRGRIGDRALILLYHRVGASSADPFHLAVTPERFAAHMAVIRRSADPIHLDDLTASLESGRVPHGGVAVTFDDGYADNLEIARPLLEKFEIPATIFVVTGRPGQTFWWDELSRLILSSTSISPRLHVSLGRLARSWTMAGAARATRDAENARTTTRVFFSIYRFFQTLNAAQRRTALEQLASYVESTSTPSEPRALTTEELRELAGDGLVSIGAHTVTHPMLSRMAPVEQRAEIGESKAALERVVGRPVRSFSYPNGAMSRTTASLVADAGFSSACGTAGGTVGSGAYRYDMPRLWVGNWTAAEFERRVTRWLDA